MTPKWFRVWGAFAYAFFAALGWAFLVLDRWYTIADSHNTIADLVGTGPWFEHAASDWTDTHTGLFFVFVTVAFIGARLIGLWVYRWSLGRMMNYDAVVLHDRWIRRRRDREMAAVLRTRWTPPQG